MTNILINRVELATRLAKNALITTVMGATNYSYIRALEKLTYENEDGIIVYNDIAQKEFDNFYDWFDTAIDKCKVKVD